MREAENERAFRAACAAIENRTGTNIGTYAEKNLHAALKRYIEPDETYHEVETCGFIADVCRGDDVYEIQTRSFGVLRRKLEAYLAAGKRVTIVYPVVREKWLVWMDPETGEATKRRKSPKHGAAYEILPELYRIKSYLPEANLRFRIVLVDAEEYRALDGRSANKKRGSSRRERIPLGLAGEVFIDCAADYGHFVPAMEEPFSARLYKERTGLSLSRAQTALNVLFVMGAVERVGKRGNAFLYQKKP